MDGARPLPTLALRKIIRWFPWSLIEKTEKYPEIFKIWKNEAVTFDRVFINEITTENETLIEIFVENIRIVLKKKKEDVGHYYMARWHPKNSSGKLIWKLKYGDYTAEVVRGLKLWFNNPGMRINSIFCRNSIFNEVFDFPIFYGIQFLVARDGTIRMTLEENRKFSVSRFIKEVLKVENEMDRQRRIVYFGQEEDNSASEKLKKPLPNKCTQSILGNLPFMKRLQVEAHLPDVNSIPYQIEKIDIVENSERHAFSIDLDGLLIGVEQKWKKNGIVDFVQLRIGFYVAASELDYEGTIRSIFDHFLNRELTRIGSLKFNCSIETLRKNWKVQPRYFEGEEELDAVDSMDLVMYQGYGAFFNPKVTDVQVIRELAELIDRHEWNVGFNICSKSGQSPKLLYSLIKELNGKRTFLYPKNWTPGEKSNLNGFSKIQAVIVELKNCLSLVIGVSEVSIITDENGQEITNYLNFVKTVKKEEPHILKDSEEWLSEMDDGTKIDLA